MKITNNPIPINAGASKSSIIAHEPWTYVYTHTRFIGPKVDYSFLFRVAAYMPVDFKWVIILSSIILFLVVANEYSGRNKNRFDAFASVASGRSILAFGDR